MIERMANCAFTEFPASSNGGENAAMPNMPGMTPSTPPPTPDFAGMPDL